MNLQETPAGLLVTHGEIKIFFGNRNSSPLSIGVMFPELTPRRIKQTHSDLIVQASENLVEADAHFTAEESMALLISTADCLPVFFAHPPSGTIAGIHAGWRGVANRIVPKTVHRLAAQGISPSELLCCIGPHIKQPSFEIQGETIAMLEASVNAAPDSWLTPSKNEGRFLGDLTLLMMEQLSESGLALGNIFDVDIDTFSHSDFHSHRRDAAQAGRNLSFIAR